MIVEGEFTFDGPPDAVWELLLDPEVLVKALPGAKRLDRVEEDVYKGVMFVGVGPVTAAEFSVSISLTDKIRPQRYTMSLEGKGSIGFTHGSASVELTEADGNRTLMSYRADVQIGGRIAGVGQRLLDSASRAMAKQGLEAMNRELQARLTGTEVVAPRRGLMLKVAGIAALLLSLLLVCGPWG